MVDEEVDILLTIEADTKDAKQEVDKLTASVEKVWKETDNAEKGFQVLGETAAATAAAGAILFGAAILSAQKYVNAMGQTEATSKRWLAASKRLQDAQIEFGRKSAEALLPYQEILSTIIEKLAKIDPRLLQLGIGVGGVLTLVGAIGFLASQIGLFSIAVQRLGVFIAASQTSGGLKGASTAAGIYGTAAVVGAVGGVGATRAIGEATDDERLKKYGFEDLFETMKQILVGSIALLGIGFKELTKGLTFFVSVISIGGELVFDAFKGLQLTLAKATVDLGLSIAQIKIPIIDKTVGELAGVNTSALEKTQSNLQGVIDRRRNEDKPSFGEGVAERYDEFMMNIDPIFGAFEASVVELSKIKLSDILEPIKAALSSDNEGEGVNLQNQQLLADFESFLTEQRQVEKDFNDVRLTQQKEFANESLKIEDEWEQRRLSELENFERNRNQVEKAQRDKVKQQTTDFNSSQKQEYDAYLDQRRKTDTDYAIETLERDKAFRVRQIRAEEDSRARLLDAAGRLDAVSVLRELQSSGSSKKRDREDFSNESDTRQKSFERQKAIDDAEFTKQQQQKAAQFGIDQLRQKQEFENSQKLAKENFQRARDQAAKEFNNAQRERQNAFNIQQEQERAAYLRQRTVRQAQFVDQANQIQQFGQYEITARQAHYSALQKQLDSFLNNARGAAVPQTIQQMKKQYGLTTMTPFAEGGYANAGEVGLFHGREFVASPQTTRILEQGLGSLTQGKLLSALANGGRGGSKTISVENNIQAGNFSIEVLEGLVQRVMTKVLGDIGS